VSTTLKSVDLVFHREAADGREIEIRATVTPEYGYEQWGAVSRELGDNVDALIAIEEALVDYWATGEAS
jgi:Ni,Fe-hydrogenase III small subunit